MGPIKRAAVLILLLLIGIAPILLGQLAAAAENEKMITVRTLVAKIKSDPTKAERYKLAEELMEFVGRMDRSDRDMFDPEMVDEIASLLVLDDETIRAFAASALGSIGPPAALRSVGALLKALREAESDSRRIYRDTAYNAMDAIIGALHRLGVCVFRIENYNRKICDYLLR
jgi:hypothetical protein